MERLSLGVDIEEVDRFRKLLRNKRFVNRVFSAPEVAYCRKKKNQAQHFAVRFAAKEAVWKALSEALEKSQKKISHKDITIQNDANGKPKVVLPSRFSKLRKNIRISLSHTRSYAVATALLKA